MSAMQLKPCLQQLNRATVNTLNRLDCSQCFAEKKLKIYSDPLNRRLLFKFLHRKIRSNQVKLNFDVQPQNKGEKLPYNNGVIKTTQKHVSKLGYNGNVQSQSKTISIKL